MNAGMYGMPDGAGASGQFPTCTGVIAEATATQYASVDSIAQAGRALTSTFTPAGSLTAPSAAFSITGKGVVRWIAINPGVGVSAVIRGQLEIDGVVVIERQITLSASSNGFILLGGLTTGASNSPVHHPIPFNKSMRVLVSTDAAFSTKAHMVGETYK